MFNLTIKLNKKVLSTIQIHPRDCFLLFVFGINNKHLSQGWILVGYPKTRDQALALQRHGIFAKHIGRFLSIPIFLYG